MHRKGLKDIPLDRAEECNEAGRQALASGRLEQAEALFREAISLFPEDPAPWFNLGLIYKQRRAWSDCLRCNLEALRHAGPDEPTFWNLGIAATALSDWKNARTAWEGLGLRLPAGPGPWQLKLPMVPIRVNPDEAPEVVWCDRLDLVRTRIANVPLPQSARRYGDLLLNDGEPIGHRRLGDREVPVFNELAVLQPSEFGTWEAAVEVRDRHGLDNLIALLGEHDLAGEDWTGSIRRLCKACSEGRPHDHHDEELPAEGWQPRRRLGLAARSQDELERLLGLWQGGTVHSLERVL